MPELIDPVFAKTSPKRSFCMSENERFGLVFVKTGSVNSDTGVNRVSSARRLVDYELLLSVDITFIKMTYS